MATHSSDIVFSNATVEQFRAWGSAMTAAFQSVGLVKETITGEIDWTTVGLPSSSLSGDGSRAALWQVWRFNDSLQATAPIYFMLEFARNSTSTAPAMRITTGQGVDAGGNLTGVKSYSTAFIVNASPSDAIRHLRVCHTNGIAWMHVGADPSTTPPSLSGKVWGCFAISRSGDGAGAPSAVGYTVYTTGYTNTSATTGLYGQPMRLQPSPMPVVTTPDYYSASFPLSAGTIPSTVIDGKPQVFPMWTWINRMYPSHGIAYANGNEVAYDATVLVSLFGETSKRYISRWNSTFSITGMQNAAVVLLWE